MEFVRSPLIIFTSSDHRRSKRRERIVCNALTEPLSSDSLLPGGRLIIFIEIAISGFIRYDTHEDRVTDASGSIEQVER